MTGDHLRNTGPMLSSLRCGAKTRSGKLCRSPAVQGNKRCRMHSGAAGSGAPIGNKNAQKSGLYTREAIAQPTAQGTAATATQADPKYRVRESKSRTRAALAKLGASRLGDHARVTQRRYPIAKRHHCTGRRPRIYLVGSLPRVECGFPVTFLAANAFAGPCVPPQGRPNFAGTIGIQALPGNGILRQIDWPVLWPNACMEEDSDHLEVMSNGATFIACIAGGFCDCIRCGRWRRVPSANLYR